MILDIVVLMETKKKGSGKKHQGVTFIYLVKLINMKKLREKCQFRYIKVGLTPKKKKKKKSIDEKILKVDMNIWGYKVNIF